MVVTLTPKERKMAKKMARPIVVSKSSLNDAFVKLLQQNPDALISEVINTFEQTEGHGSMNKLTLSVQDIKAIKDPDFEDHAIRGELQKVTTQIIEYLKVEAETTGKDFTGKTRSEIEAAIHPSDHLATFAFAEAMKRLMEDQTIEHIGGERKGNRYALAKK